MDAKNLRADAVAAGVGLGFSARYIAVRTPKKEQNTGKEAVMVYDTQRNGIVGNQVYDLEKSPKVGSVQEFDTYTAEYVGG